MKKLVCLHKHLHIVTGLLCIIASFITNTVLAQSNGIVGSLGGDVSVSPMGMATYSIPIDVVPGTKGVQPNLAIVYNSSSGRGYLGSNWQLSGLSSITRVQRTQYPDGSIGTVNLDGNDRYALDGAKLMKLSGGDYASTNAKYGTEIENFTRVTLKGTPNDVSQYFVAVTDQGEIIEYGNTEDSKQKTTNNKVVSWMVNKITDADGNFMTISYGQSTSNGEIWPTEINYTGNTAAGLSTYAKVVFQYTTDSNINTTYIGGKIIRPTKLLNKILVKYENELVRQYDFNYTTDRSTRLNAVILKDASGEELTRTTIGWGNDATSNTIKTYNSLVGYMVCIGDYNGDNLPDLFLSSYDSNSNVTSWQIRLGDGTGNFNSVSYSSTLNGYYYQFSTIDIDGSGKDGIGFISANSNNNGYSYKVIKLNSNSHTITTKATNVNSKFHLGDFLGQGGVQFLCESNPSNNYITLTSSDFNASITVHKDSKISVTDFNGNGKSDIHVVRGTTVDIYEYDESSASFVKILNSGTLTAGSGKDYFGDFNGDGKQDYIHFKSPNWYLKMSKGNAYTDDITLPFNYSTSSSGEPSYPIFVFDFNGDGKDDIVQPVYNYNTNKTTLNIYYSRGFDNGTYNYELQYVQNNGIYHWEDAHYRFGDLDCDGKVDMLYIGAIQHAPVLVSSREKRKHDLVLSFTNGIGKCSTLEYAYYNSPNIGNFGTVGKRVHFPLVSKLREPNGIGGITETTFTYSHAAFDFERRQLLGFELYQTHCQGTNTKMLFDVNDDYHYLNLQQSLTYYMQRGNNAVGGYIGDSSYWENSRTNIYYHEIYNTLSYLGLSYSRFIPYNSISSNINRLENTQIMSKCWLNSTDGRLTKSSVANIDNDSHLWISRDSTVYTYTDVTIPNGQTIKKISSTKTWNKRNGFTQMPYQYTTYDYSTSGRLTSKNVSDSDGNVGTTSYNYNYVGLPTSETCTPNGMTARTKSFVYGSKYRFVIQETNALGHSKSATFDDWTGLMTSQTDVNYLTTTYQYDALGRLTDVTRPDRTEHHISYNWNNVSAFSNAVYYTSETEVGQPEAKSYYDVLGRAIHTYVAGRGYDDVVYNELGLVSKTTYVPYSTPSTAFGNKTWHTNNYDNYNRIVSETDPYTNLSYSYYDYNNPTMHEYFVTITDNIRNSHQTRKHDAVGRVTQVIDEGGTINYSYSYQTEGGKIRDLMSISVGGNTTTIKSDIRGNRLSIQDPDAGTITSTYNVLNQLVTRTDANMNQAAYTYDLIGRTTEIVYSKGTESETITYTYDNATGSGMGKLASVKKNGSNDCIFVYDDLGRLSNRKVYDGNTIYNHRYEYNDLGQLQYFTYPDSYCIENVYNSYGELKQIKNAADNSLIYAADTRNKFRQPLKCRYGNETGVQYTYNAYGMLTGIKNGDVVGSYDVNGVGIEIDVDVNYSINNQYRQLAYSYNDRGFIESRTDAKVNQSETYTYDNLDRLTSYTVNGTTAASFTYGNTGNILTNSKVGIYSYGNSKPHAVTDIAGNSSCPISASQCDVTYNLRNKPTAIAENGYRITLDYDAAGMRRHTRYYQGNTMQKATAKISDVYEFELGSGAQRKLDYIYAEGQLVAVHVKRGIVDSLYYVMTDHLGSWNKVMDEDKNIVQQTHFDPWGNRMSYTAWNTPQTQTTFPFSRGYTGHEHYDSFKIINANARLYDPMIGRFFSPDPFVQAPDFTQNYNRYSYCMNNPVMFNDENGEWVHIVVGAVIGGVSNLVGNWRNCDGFWQYAAAFGAGAASGAVSAALPGWGSLIGGAITGATNSAIAQTGNNFTNNGAFNWEQFGTSCVAGAAAGIAGYGGGMLGARAANVAIGSLNIVSPVTKGFIGGVLGGGIGGYTGGFVGGLVMSNGNLDAALSAGLSGAYQGAGLGGATGVAGGFYYAKKHNLNPWTGVKKGSVTIGENMVRVSMAQKQLKNETIKSVWPKGLEGYIREDARIINPEAMDFNAQWIEFLKEQNAYIYDIGTPNGSPVSSPFYNMEQARTMDYLNLIKVNGIDGKIIWYRNGN
jgi:RHS repeat-associated protein